MFTYHLHGDTLFTPPPPHTHIHVKDIIILSINGEAPFYQCKVSTTHLSIPDFLLSRNVNPTPGSKV